MADDEREPDEPVEDSKVHDWRVLQALEVGLEPGEAEKWAAGDGDLGRLRDLVKRGWPAGLAARTA